MNKINFTFNVPALLVMIEEYKAMCLTGNWEGSWKHLADLKAIMMVARDNMLWEDAHPITRTIASAEAAMRRGNLEGAASWMDDILKLDLAMKYSLSPCLAEQDYAPVLGGDRVICCAYCKQEWSCSCVVTESSRELADAWHNVIRELQRRASKGIYVIPTTVSAPLRNDMWDQHRTEGLMSLGPVWTYEGAYYYMIENLEHEGGAKKLVDLLTVLVDLVERTNVEANIEG